MNKHIFGFALFSFIVGVAIAVSGWLTFKTVTVNVFEVEKAPRVKDRNYCMKEKFRNSEYADVKIEQAVLDVNTKQLKTFLRLNPRAEDDKAFVALHFFVKNGNETRYLKSSHLWIDSDFDAEKESVLSSSDWLESLESYDNLYIVPQMNNGRANYKKNPPRFDSESAVPVLLSKGKGF